VGVGVGYRQKGLLASSGACSRVTPMSPEQVRIVGEIASALRWLCLPKG
jgi:hypothetical protein